MPPGDWRAQRTVFNVTGATKAMAVAAALASMITGSRTVYIPEETEEARVTDLPLPRLALRSVLSPARARVLEAIASGQYPSLRDLAKRLRLSPATISHHVFRLRDMCAVHVERAEDPRLAAPRVTETGQVLLLFHGELQGFGQVGAQLAADSRPCSKSTRSLSGARSSMILGPWQLERDRRCSHFLCGVENAAVVREQDDLPFLAQVRKDLEPAFEPFVVEV